tara:strand:+ start:3667 stop:3987 length:321 start_codon:yes stop_codon:yes gene_type:complete
MIPFIRSLAELMAVTESRDNLKKISNDNVLSSSTIDSGQRKRYIRSIRENEIKMPNLPKSNRRKWNKSKEAVSKFLDKLDYNNQIQSSYDLTLLARQSKKDHKDAA